MVAASLAQVDSILAEDWMAGVLDEFFFLILGNDPIGERRSFSLAVVRSLHMLTKNLVVVRVDNFLHQGGAGDEVVAWITADAFTGWRIVKEPSVRRDPKLPIVSKICHQPVFFLAVFQLFLRSFSFGTFGSIDGFKNRADSIDANQQ